MTSDLIDCTCFRLSAPDHVSLRYVHPGHVYLHAARAASPRPVVTCMFIQNKTLEDQQHADFSALFRARWASRRYEEDHPVEQRTIGEHTVWLSPAFDNTSHDFVLSAAIDLDEDHYLYASVGYYIDKSHTIFNHVDLEDKELSIFTDDDVLEEYGKVFADLQNIKQAVTDDAHDYLSSLLENLQLLGDYAPALEAQHADFVQDIPQRPQNARLVKETHFNFIKPGSLIGKFYGGTDKAIAEFELNHGTGRMQAELLWRDPENRSMDFSDFFREWIFGRYYQKHAPTPVATLNIDHHRAKLACSLRPDGRFSLIGAIEPDDPDNICCLEFEADYQLDETTLSDAAKKADALAEVYHYLFAVFASVRIKDQVIQSSKREAEQEEQDEQAAWNARMRWHQQNYTSAEAQAADPFHARYYPDLFAQLQAKLEAFPDLPLIDRQGIYTNARLAIGFIPTEEDDYSTKGNTRFFGIPDLLPGVEYPRYDPKAKPSADKTGTLCKFFAQINFAEMKGMQDYLPDSGILYLFIDSLADSNIAYGNVLEPRMVLYFDGDTNALQSARDLNIKPDDVYDVANGYEHEEGAYPARVKIITYVDILHTVEEWDAMDYPPKIYNLPALGHIPAASSQVIHSMNSYVRDVYNDKLRVNGAHVTSPYVEAAKVLGGKPEDYVVLLNLGWDQKVSGFMFGDAGYAYFMIAKEKLKNRDFSQIYYNATSY